MSDTQGHDHSHVRDNLTEEEARDRAKRLSGIGYALHLDLRAKSDTYRGEVACELESTGGPGLFLDFTGKTIVSLLVNGKSVTPEWNGHRIQLPELARGRNRIVVAWENAHSRTGTGFHKFNDPEDGREYVFTDFEPFNAHQLFPCFDQPDLKATYDVSVTAPEPWIVVANGAELEATPAGEGRTRRVFAKTEPFSTYLVAVIAGEYAVYHDRAGEIPLRILCRKALTKFIDPEEVFTVTKQGFEFYQEYFRFPYPFVKYDQAFVPEFNAGAMENTAAVTHGEHMIFRGQVSETQRLNRAETVLHELAHMWFGDLATMRWWDDLWLNESFATYISVLCMARATRFHRAWESFHSKIKAWAMKQDELVTTHPIAGRVPDTDATFLNFDGITYGKGASVLKQLHHYLGEEAFRDGLRLYFQRHAWGNATLKDFLGALSEAARKDLGEWSKLWIETSGLGSLGARWTTAGGKITAFSIEQEPAPGSTVLRPHKLEVGLLAEDASGRCVPAKSVPVLVTGARTEVPALVGQPAPAFVTPNHGDHAYAKIVLDATSLGYIRERLERIEEPLVKATLWGTLWQMVRDQKLPAADYVALVAGKAQHETSPDIVETLVGNASMALSRYLGVAGPEGPKNALQRLEAEGRRALVARCWSRLAETRGDLQLTWLRATIGLAASPADLDRLVRLMDGDEKIAGVEIDQEMRWSLIAKLVAWGRPGAEDRLARERARDTSDKGKKQAFQAEASRPTAAEKTRIWELFTGESSLSSDFLKNGMGRFHWAHQAELLDPFVTRFFDEVTGVFEKKSPEYAKAFALLLYPGYRAERPVLAKGEALLGKTTQPTLHRLLREANDELGRSIRCRELQVSRAGS